MTLPYSLFLPLFLYNSEKTAPHSSMEESPTTAELRNKRMESLMDQEMTLGLPLFQKTLLPHFRQVRDLTLPSSPTLLSLQLWEDYTSLFHGGISHHNWIVKQEEPTISYKELGNFPLILERILAHCKFLHSVVSSLMATRLSQASNLLNKTFP